MTDAAVPSGPSASQLSENIGDVLASIRRMIAQDTLAGAATADTASVLRLGAVSGAAARPAVAADAAASRAGLNWGSAAAIPAQREELLARAQSWTQRQPPGPGTLRLERSELVAEAPAAAVPVPAIVEADLVADPVLPPLAASGPEYVRVDAAWADIAPAEGVDSGDADAATDDQPATTIVSAMDMPPETTAADINPPALQDWAGAPASSLSETILLETAMNAYAPAQPTADLTIEAGDEDALSGSIFSGMIRDVIRQELGDPSGRMSRELRAMILREVARAITGEAARRE